MSIALIKLRRIAADRGWELDNADADVRLFLRHLDRGDVQAAWVSYWLAIDKLPAYGSPYREVHA